MNIYVDTCVIIDFLSKREPFYQDAYELFCEIAKDERLIAYTSVKSVSDIYYVLHGILHNDIETRKMIIKLISLLYVSDNSSIDLLKTFSSKKSDFEDDLISQLSRRMCLDYIVTRNCKDFDDSVIKAITPKKCLEILKLPELDT